MDEYRCHSCHSASSYIIQFLEILHDEDLLLYWRDDYFIIRKDIGMNNKETAPNCKVFVVPNFKRLIFNENML